MALNRFRNALWKIVSANTTATVEVQRATIDRDADLEKLSARYLQINYLATEAQKSENLMEILLNHARNDFERQELALYRALEHADYFENVDWAQLISNYDAIQVLKNLELIHKTESAIDPEILEYEKLRARYLLNEEGAEEKLRQFVRDRPFFHPYQLWASPEEKHSVKLWPF